MLQPLTVPASLAALVAVFGPCFTAPSFRTFTALVVGMIAQPGRRTVCGMLSAAGLAGVWHHSWAHWFFARACWDVGQLSTVLAAVVVQRLVPPGAPVLVAVDDTLLRRVGRRVAAAFWQYDGSVNGPQAAKVGYGNNWVIAGIVVHLPFLGRPVCLPVAAALRPSSKASKQALACDLVAGISAACPGRVVHVVADSWYAGMDGAATVGHGACPGRGLPAGVSLTSRLKSNAVLTAIATPTPGAPGRPKRIGARLGTPAQLAARSTFTRTTVTRYTRTTQIDLAEHTVLWYGVYRSRAVRVILLREPARRTRAGHHLALITTDLTSTPEQIIERYAARWSIEVAIEDAKQITGVGQARNRTPTAVARTTAFGLLVQTLVVLWYAQHGHPRQTVTQRRRNAPWYRTKTEPSYHDMIVTLRRTLIAARFRTGNPAQPTPEQTRAIHLAWEQAAA